MKLDKTPSNLDSAQIIDAIHRLPEGDLKQRLWKLLDRWGTRGGLALGSNEPDWIEAQAFLAKQQPTRPQPTVLSHLMNALDLDREDRPRPTDER